ALADRACADLADWTPPVFPVKGGAIVARGVSAGPAVARVLRVVEAQWVAEGFPGSDRIDTLLDTAIAAETAAQQP
ncbi:hypothetical protein, partial [Enterococcus faecalis]|uniref:hypothetical protein n=1 Tax=Enterococcus faecalis TaxID=1351 RepID=UPI00403F621E